MKNKFNILVGILVLACLADSVYRVYKTYQHFKNNPVVSVEESK
jgi:hypothetical protein